MTFGQQFHQQNVQPPLTSNYWAQPIALEIQVMAWDGQKNVVGLNWLMGSYLPLDNDNNNMIHGKQTIINLLRFTSTHKNEWHHMWLLDKISVFKYETGTRGSVGSACVAHLSFCFEKLYRGPSIDASYQV